MASPEYKTEQAYVGMLQDECPSIPTTKIFGALRIGAKSVPYVLVTAKTAKSAISPTNGTKIMDVEIEVAWEGDNPAAGDPDAHQGWCEEVFAAAFQTPAAFKTAINAQSISEFTCYGYTAEPGGEQTVEDRIWRNVRRLQCVIAEIDGGLA